MFAAAVWPPYRTRFFLAGAVSSSIPFFAPPAVLSGPPGCVEWAYGSRNDATNHARPGRRGPAEGAGGGGRPGRPHLRPCGPDGVHRPPDAGRVARPDPRRDPPPRDVGGRD